MTSCEFETPTLLDGLEPEAEGTETPLTQAEKFRLFHGENPAVYAALCRRGREWITRTGRTKVGISALFEVVRWEIALTTNDPDFKINNNFQPWYSRLIMRNEPDLSELFEIRKSAADDEFGLAS
jgi:hypothetical protein